MRKVLFFLFVVIGTACLVDACRDVSAQVRLVDTSARPKNTYRLVESYKEFNTAAMEFNKEWEAYKTCWEIKPERLLPHIQKMRDELNKAESLLLHIDEVEP
jgi:hypothetical protein